MTSEIKNEVSTLIKKLERKEYGVLSTFKDKWRHLRMELANIESLLLSYFNEKNTWWSCTKYDPFVLRYKVFILRYKINSILEYDYYNQKINNLNLSLTNDGKDPQFDMVNLYETIYEMSVIVLRLDMDLIIDHLNKMVEGKMTTRNWCK